MRSQIRKTLVRAPSWQNRLKIRQVIDTQVTVNWIGAEAKDKKPCVDVRLETNDDETIELFLSPSEARALGTRLIEEGDRVILTVKHWERNDRV